MKKFLTLIVVAMMSLPLAAADKTTKIIPLGDLKYKDIESSCQTILNKEGEILYFPNNNAIMVESSANNVKRMELFVKYAQDELTKKTTKSDGQKTNAAASAQKIPNYKIIPLGNVDYGSVESSCRPWLSPNGKMLYSITNNAVIVTDTPKVIEAIEKFIADLAKITPKPVYDNIQYSSPGSNDSSTVIIYSDWGDGWPYYPRRYRRPPTPPRPPRPPVPIPIPLPDAGNKPAPNLRPGDIQRRPDGPGMPRPDGVKTPVPSRTTQP